MLNDNGNTKYFILMILNLIKILQHKKLNIKYLIYAKSVGLQYKKIYCFGINVHKNR